MKRKPIIAVVGQSSPEKSLEKIAEEAGRLIAKEGWILVNGGLTGVMEASARGAASAEGLVAGILPGPATAQANEYITIPIATNMGHARNAVIAHTAEALIAIGGGEGTLSEIAIGLKLGKLVVGIRTWEIEGVVKVADAEEAVEKIQRYRTKR